MTTSLIQVDSISVEEFLQFFQRTKESSGLNELEILETYLILESKESLLAEIAIYDRQDLFTAIITHFLPLGLIEKIKSSKDKKCRTFLHLIVLSSSIRLLKSIKELFQHDEIFLNAQTAWGETALHLAAGIGNIEITRYLLEMNIDQGIKDQWGRSAADIAQETGHSDLFQKTALSSSNLTPPEDNKSTNVPSVISAPKMMISNEFMAALKKKQQSTSEEGKTTVIVKSIFSEAKESIQSSTTSSEKTQKINASLTSNKKTAISKLLEYPGNPDQLSFYCAHENHDEYDINGKDMYGLAAIHKISSWNKVDLLDIILKHDLINVNLAAAPSQSNFTALHFAIENSAINTFRRLLEEKEIQIDLLDKKGRTPLQLAEELKAQDFIGLLYKHQKLS